MPADLFQRFVEGEALPLAGGQVEFRPLIGDDRAAADFRGDGGEQFLGQVHQIIKRRIGPVEFAHGEFGVVTDGDAFIAEVAVQLENFFKAAHEEALEVQFGRDAHVQFHVQRIMVGDERTRRRAARHGVEHGGFHFHKAAFLKEGAEGTDDFAALAENVADLRIGDEVHIPLAVADFDVGEALVLFRQGPERLGEQGDLITGEGQLVGLGAEKLPVHAHDVADVELFEVFVGFLTHEVFGRIALDTAAAIHKMEKRDLAEGAVGDDASGTGERLVQFFEFGGGTGFVFGPDGSGVMRLHESIEMKRDPGIHEFAGFDHAVFDDFVELVFIGEALKHGHEIGCVG